MKSTPGNLVFRTNVGAVTTAMPSSGTINSDPLWLDQVLWFGVQIFWTGSPDGNWTLEGSLDKGQADLQTGVVTGVTNWTTISDSSIPAGSAAGNLVQNFEGAAFRWARVKYTAATVGGTITSATWSMKGF